MRSYRDGAVLAPGGEGVTASRSRELAERFFVYGAYSEMFAREAGFNRGLGGSMHAFFTAFGIYPNNAIVGGSGSIAPGAALFKRVNRRARHRGGQHRRRLLQLRPGVGGHHLRLHGPVPQAVGRVPRRRAADRLQLHEQLLRHGRPARGRDHGHAVHRPLRRRRQSRADARRGVNGYNPLAVIDAFERKPASSCWRAAARCCWTPLTYRYSGHSPSDASSYRSRRGDRAVAGGRLHRRLPRHVWWRPVRSTRVDTGRGEDRHRGDWSSTCSAWRST